MPSVPPPDLSPPGPLDPSARNPAVPEKFTALPLGSVRPLGWLHQQLEENLAQFTGHLAELVPDLIVHDQIYGRDRLTAAVRHKDVGAQGVPVEQQAQFLWWNSETQSNWWDGFIRTAVLTGQPEALRRARRQVATLLATQDADGYLGIYAPDLRYRFQGENGELWAKATALRYLLGWHEYSGDAAVLQAVVRAVDNLRQNYPAGQSHPFQSDRPDTSGLAHGLAITDVLEALYRLTGNAGYLDYLLFCYRDFSAQALAEDAQLAKLLDPKLPLSGHGVHTYEHLRSVAAAAHTSGQPALARALANFLRKIEPCLTASGGPVGDEWIDGRGACASSRGYEYCSLQELLHSYASLLLKTGRAEFGDRIERLFFNAAQGARLPQGAGIAYLKSDNSYAMTGPLNGDASTPGQNRYKYSPVHQDVAVCCAPNAGRIGPCYVQHMWAREGSTLIACLLGPSDLRTEIEGQPVHIVVETAYPYDQVLNFKITAPGLNLTLKVRRPAWASQLTASAPWSEQAGYLVFSLRLGSAPTVLTVVFAPDLIRQHDVKGEVYYTFGALVLARAIPARESTARTYPLPGYADRKFTANQSTVFCCPHDAPVRPAPNQTLRFEAEFANVATQAREKVLLEPMGQTILRQTTFPEAGVPRSSPSTPR